MGESQKITWKVTVTTKANVTPFKLYLKESELKHGKWASKKEPPSEISAPAPGGVNVVEFISMGRWGSWYGTEGRVTYESEDNASNPTVLEFTWSIPVYDDNSANLMVKSGAPNGTYSINPRPLDIPASGWDIKAEVSLEQVKPDI